MKLALRHEPILRALYGFARSRVGRTVIGWVFGHASFVIPVHRLRETDTLIVFHHPRPQHAFHVLLVPRRAVASLAELSSSDSAFLSDLVGAVQQLVQEYRLPAYRLIVNGGSYQDFPQLHFHLVSDDRGSRGSSSNGEA